MEIRLMKKNEVDQVRSLISKVLSKKCENEYKNTKNTFGVIATNNGEIIGVATVYIHDDEIVGEQDYFISNLCIEPKYQRMGVATKIIKYIEEKAEKEKIKYIYTLVPTKYEETSLFYQKLSYELKNINCFRKEL